MTTEENPMLTTIDGMTATTAPFFDRESWTTCGIRQHDRGTVFSLPGAAVVQVVLIETTTEPVPGQAHGRTFGKVADLATGEIRAFELPGNTSVLTRCDLHYVTA